MRTVQRYVALSRHIFRLWRTGQLRFRLETYGLYYPALPYRAPWWRVSPRSLVLLLRQTDSYARWLAAMDVLAQRCRDGDRMSGGGRPLFPEVAGDSLLPSSEAAEP